MAFGLQGFLQATCSRGETQNSKQLKVGGCSPAVFGNSSSHLSDETNPRTKNV